MKWNTVTDRCQQWMPSNWGSLGFWSEFILEKEGDQQGLPPPSSQDASISRFQHVTIAVVSKLQLAKAPAWGRLGLKTQGSFPLPWVSQDGVKHCGICSAISVSFTLHPGPPHARQWCTSAAVLAAAEGAGKHVRIIFSHCRVYFLPVIINKVSSTILSNMKPYSHSFLTSLIIQWLL